MALRYIGSKARVVDAIMAHLGEPDGGTFVDAFCGTGAVAQAAAERGWPVLANDHLVSAVITTGARLTPATAAPFASFGGYAAALALLNDAPKRKGFIWREYSPASTARAGLERRYFTEANAQRIDGIRATIREWSIEGRLGEAEERVLLADLMGAANRVANTAGTYGCFLSTWQRGTEESLFLVPRQLPRRLPPTKVCTGDAMEVRCSPEDTAYLDPPYTKRQYAAYYHVLETIAVGDEPEVEGVCGIRPWHHLASDYCYRTRAASALVNLVSRLPARRILLSYSTEGHVHLDHLADALCGTGRVSVHILGEIGRYRPNVVASQAAAHVGEVLISIERDVLDARRAA